MGDIKVGTVSAQALGEGKRHLEVKVANADGSDTRLKLTSAAAFDLMKVLTDYCAGITDGRGEATKIPESFAVGAGRFDPYVLVRFEDEAPYGLKPADAVELAYALIEQAEELGDRGNILHH